MRTVKQQAERDREIIALSNEVAERVISSGDYCRARALIERFRLEVLADINKDHQLPESPHV